jgi:hypothetical protein
MTSQLAMMYLYGIACLVAGFALGVMWGESNEDSDGL